jgi:serine/tyrosine/threonine adenylyltransferase
MLEVLGIDPEESRSPEFAHVFTGGRVPDGADPHAAAYGGHQFGNWAGQLGDGRAISLGSAIATDGSRLELQLKGAGPTPYSRRADGLAVLRSSLREFLCSEAMHHLGVPTTRALSLAVTGDMVMRDMFYDGNPEWEPGAVVCRVAPSFIRFGNFQLHTWRNETDHLRALADHTIRHHFPELEPGDVAGMYAEVVRGRRC